MEEKLEFYYVRHADTDPSNHPAASNCDIDISELGEKQIALLGERFRAADFDCILCSPLVRCIKTAAAVCNAMGTKPQVEIMPELIENGSLPEYKGIDIDFLRRYYDNLKLCDDRVHYFESNITDEENDERAKALANYFKSRFHYGEKILIVCHGSFGNHLIPAMVEMGRGNYILSLSNTGVTKMKFTSDGKQRLSFLNDISHLRPLMPEYEFDT